MNPRYNITFASDQFDADHLAWAEDEDRKEQEWLKQEDAWLSEEQVRILEIKLKEE
jgi:hypothetical protein